LLNIVLFFCALHALLPMLGSYSSCGEREQATDRIFPGAPSFNL